ncbi:Ig-like domain-containing protein, partial [Burkholderiaceae bacterium]|nr:Ig-like domain-containing protein [Burkholderiaceae bacterium]
VTFSEAVQGLSAGDIAVTGGVVAKYPAKDVVLGALDELASTADDPAMLAGWLPDGNVAAGVSAILDYFGGYAEADDLLAVANAGDTADQVLAGVALAKSLVGAMDEAEAQTVLTDLTSTDPQLQLLSSDAISEITTHSYAVEPVDGQSNTWTVKVVVADNSTDDLVVSIKDTVKDQSGNALGTTSATFTLAVDTENPEVATIVPDANTASDGSDVVGYTVTFKEAVQGVTSEDLSVLGGEIVGSVELAADGLSARFDVRALNDSVENLSVTVKDTVKDLAGNALVSATDATVTVDTLNPSAPILESEDADGVSVNDLSTSAAFSFNAEPGAAVTLELKGSNYTAAETALTAATSAAGATAAGLVGAIAANSDAQAEVTTATSAAEAAAAALVGATTADSDAKTDVATLQGVVDVAIVTISETGTGGSVDVVLTASQAAALGDGDVTVKGTQVDAAGNVQEVSASELTIRIDTAAPEVATIVPAPNSASDTSDTVSYTVTFNEAVQGFDASNISVTGGSIAQYAAKDVVLGALDELSSTAQFAPEFLSGWLPGDIDDIANIQTGVTKILTYLTSHASQDEMNIVTGAGDTAAQLQAGVALAKTLVGAMDEAGAQAVLDALTADGMGGAPQLLSTAAIAEINQHAYQIEPVDGVANAWTVKVQAFDDSVENLSVMVKDTVKDLAGNALVPATDDTVTVDTRNP